MSKELIERLRSGEPYDFLVKEAVADRIEALEKQRDALLVAAEAIQFNADECIDFDGCAAMLMSMDDYHNLMEAVDNARGRK